MNGSDAPPAPAGFAPFDSERTSGNKAVEKLRTLKDPDLSTLSPEEIRRTFHELRRHQIELAIENEGLHQTLRKFKDITERQQALELLEEEDQELLYAAIDESDRIKQVILNLLTNAGDACHQPGGIITINTWQEHERVAISIRDTGIGIQPEHLDLIFQPFYTTKAEVMGTGLGLSVRYGIVKNHQGDFRVESKAGQGATFTILLPTWGMQSIYDPCTENDKFEPPHSVTLTGGSLLDGQEHAA